MKDVASAIRQAKTSPTTENLEEMWRQVFRLPAWYLLPSTPEGPATPLVARLDDGDWVVAFTHLRAVNAFAEAIGLRSASGDIPMLTLTPAEAIERLFEVADHVDGLVFNAGGELALRSPVSAVRELAERFENVKASE